MTYMLISSKGSRMFRGTQAEAIDAAVEMEAELQPSFGVSVEDEDGETVADVRDGKVQD